MTSQSDLAFVRRDMLQPEAPPITVAGPLAWARKNLFSGPFSTLLTLAGAYVAYPFAAMLAVLGVTDVGAVLGAAVGSASSEPELTTNSTAAIGIACSISTAA